MILYKYLPPARRDVLSGRMIRFTQPGALNDIFEFRPALGQLAPDEVIRSRIEQNFDGLLDAEIDKYEPLPPGISRVVLKNVILSRKDLVVDLINQAQPVLLKALAPHIDEKISETVGVLSLSETCDSALMWAHYAESSTGFAVGFDSHHTFFHQRRNSTDEFGFLREVKYQTARPNVELNNTSSLEWFQTKSEEWKYEKEWRIIRPLLEASRRIEATPLAVYLFAFPAEAIAEVIYGPRTSDEVKQELFKASTILPRAQLSVMHEQNQGYGLLKKSIS